MTETISLSQQDLEKYQQQNEDLSSQERKMLERVVKRFIEPTVPPAFATFSFMEIVKFAREESLAGIEVAMLQACLFDFILKTFGQDIATEVSNFWKS